MNCLIIDDEPIAISIIESYLLQIEGFEVVGKCRNAVEAYNMLQKKAVDLLFLDIEMPKLNGLNFLKTLKNPPKVIITTAYREFALDGFDLNAVDYLLKPIRFERFLQAVQKVRPMNPVDHCESESYMFVKSGGERIKVMFADILYIEGLSNYVKFVLSGNKVLVSYLKISDLAATLPQKHFIQIHKSYIIAKQKITAYSKNQIRIGDKNLSVGSKYLKSVTGFMAPTG
jgi:DNA-binding LytR/AlgR family response regulator